MSEAATTVRSTRVLPASLEEKTYGLSPNDICESFLVIPLSWPVFFNYDVDGDKMEQALKTFLEKYPILCGRVTPHEDTRYVVKVDPSAGESQGIPFTEYKSDMSVAEAVKEHMLLRAPVAEFPVMPKLPFFLESLDSTALLKGEEPIMKVKLTHLSDGCVLSVAIQHMIMDGQRYVEAIRDLARAYRQEEIPDRSHDRSSLWPDEIAKKFPAVGEDVAKLPRKVLASGELFKMHKFPDEGCQLYVLHFPDESIANMKAVVNPFLKEGEFVSTGDCLLAFCWMLQCEMMAKKHPVMNGSDLEVDNTFVVFTYEVLRNGCPIVPETYSGNAFAGNPLASAGQELASASLDEAFAKLAMLMRTTLNTIKGNPVMVAQSLLAYYQMAVTGQMPDIMSMDGFRGPVTNISTAPFKEIDLGEGPPAFAFPLPLPFSGPGCALGPGPKFDGLTALYHFRDSQADSFKNSVIRKKFAPEMKELFSDYTMKEIKAMTDA